MKQVVAITAGDAAGIGPEIIVRTMMNLRSSANCLPLLIGHPEIFRAASEVFGLNVQVEEFCAGELSATGLQETLQQLRKNGVVGCWNPAGDEVLRAPRCTVSREAGEAAFRGLEAAIHLALSRSVCAIVTAPLNKESLHLAGHHYPGHTEILAEYCGVNEFAMMLHMSESAVSPWRQILRRSGQEQQHVSASTELHGLSIAHVTLHTSVASVPSLLSAENIVDTIQLMSDFLQRIQCQRQAIAVCALNPHGGENGLFGNEEQTVIRPAVERARRFAPQVTGPLPVDTLVRRAIAGEFDGVIAMYHDQGHIPVKLIGFDSAVNVTLGLPIVRTSPTHGTAFDRAWNRETPSDPGGMLEALRTAVLLASE